MTYSPINRARERFICKPEYNNGSSSSSPPLVHESQKPKAWPSSGGNVREGGKQSNLRIPHSLHNHLFAEASVYNIYVMSIRVFLFNQQYSSKGEQSKPLNPRTDINPRLNWIQREYWPESYFNQNINVSTLPVTPIKGLSPFAQRFDIFFIKTLLNVIPNSLLSRDDLFETTCEKTQCGDESRVIRDIGQVIVRSAKTLAISLYPARLAAEIQDRELNWNSESYNTGAMKAHQGTPGRVDIKPVRNSCDTYIPLNYNKASENDIDALLAEGRAAVISNLAGTPRGDGTAPVSPYESSDGSLQIRGAASVQQSYRKGIEDNSDNNPASAATIRNIEHNKPAIPLPEKPPAPQPPCTPPQGSLQQHSSGEIKFSPIYNQSMPLISPSVSSVHGGKETPPSITLPDDLQCHCIPQPEFQNLDHQTQQDIHVWLLFTGYYDEEYRIETISRRREIVAVHEKLTELMNEEWRKRRVFTNIPSSKLSHSLFSYMIPAGARSSTPSDSSAMRSRTVEPPVDSPAERAPTLSDTCLKAKAENTPCLQPTNNPVQPSPLKRSSMSAPENSDCQRKVARSNEQASTASEFKKQAVYNFKAQQGHLTTNKFGIVTLSHNEDAVRGVIATGERVLDEWGDKEHSLVIDHTAYIAYFKSADGFSALQYGASCIRIEVGQELLQND
ncbi:hypothetical protein H113_01592 [Trichophyton rubrum MR1459]|nr:hypothetical protein H113_01592 [Trichophyton rubrum MR1459]